MRQRLLVLFLFLATATVLACGEDGSSLSSASMGGSTSPSAAAPPSSPSLASGVVDPQLDAPAPPPASGQAPIISGSSGCSENDFTCACHLVIDLISACGVDEAIDRNICSSAAEIGGYFETACARAGFSSADCWGQAISWLEHCLSGDCADMCRLIGEEDDEAEACICGPAQCEVSYEEGELKCDCNPKCCNAQCHQWFG